MNLWSESRGLSGGYASVLPLLFPSRRRAYAITPPARSSRSAPATNGLGLKPVFASLEQVGC